MRKRKLIVLLIGILLQHAVEAQQPILGLATYFEEAYWRYPNIPAGLLEATAWSASRLTNLQPSLHDADNCSGMPQRYGLFALIENGKGYFKNNLLTVCSNSGITPDQYKKDVRLQVLSVAKFLSREASFRQIDVRISTEDFSSILEKLAEFPDDSSAINKYALALFKYDIYDQLQKGINTPSLKRAPVKVQMEQIFPAPLLHTLQSPAIEINVDKDQLLTPPNTPIFTTNRQPDVADKAPTAADYSPAIYVHANANNYKSGRNGAAISHIVIHTAQGSYASVISWFKNPGAHMSTHYIVRASDGQITQMVKESDMALHVQNANGYAIGIEHEGFIENGNKWYTDKLYKASASLVRDICKRYAIDGSTCYRGLGTNTINAQTGSLHIKGHQHYSGNAQTDPGKYWNWNKYADLLQEKQTAGIEKEIQFATIANGVYRITNVNSKKVMNTRDCSGKPSAYVTQTSWEGKSCQRWRFEYAGDGWYRITNLVSGRALEVPGGSKENVQILIKDTKENDSQLWRLFEDGKKGELRMENKASGKVLEIFGGSVNNGAAVLQTAWTGKPRQKWLLAAVNGDEEGEGNRFKQVNIDSTVISGIPTKQ
ncbi:MULTISPECIES: RICIN domain-containing protein [Niastella]|uniref:N-acetylmuramoyl-L-alanine amidase n=1 Tax=Niastella soli TaxID=2821487 RepID=A0ABS3Z560_9BACT|nr:RICIN domain-containing protein [Niastella soli]MBO9205292.1 RICIN domain-containing protein [Niastella soli]